MTTASVITTVIVEDEPLARRRLRDLVRGVSWLDLVGEAATGPAAIAAIDSERPDLVFLDIRLPGSDGFEVVAHMIHRPAVIFTTAYDRFAVSAFELGAIDYLLKPFGRERFSRAVERARSMLDRRGDRDGIERAREVIAGAAVSRVFVREAGRIVPVNVSSIERVQAADDYVIVHAAGRQFTMSMALADLEARLDPNIFLRVHRSHMVNLDHVISCTPTEDSRFTITLRSGATVTASRQRSRLVRALAR